MEHKNLSNDELRAQMDEEARISEAAAYDDSDADAPLPAHVKVSRRNRRPKTLQIRLSAEELEALEAVAARRDLPVSTVAREQLLQLVTGAPGGGPLTLDSLQSQLTELTTDVRQLLTAFRGSEQVAAYTIPRRARK